jgi:hypothetical protein
MDHNKPIIINAFRGLGDIIFCIPLYRHLISQGHTVIHPYTSEFGSIWKHWPEITWVPMELLNLPYENQDYIETDDYKIVPLRWSREQMKVPYSQVMRAKYDMFGLDFMMWRQVTWERDYERERKLYDIMLGDYKEKFVFENNTFRSNGTGKVQTEAHKSGLQVITMWNVPGFTMMDWGLIMESATEIHTVGTSINFLLDAPFLNIKEPMHLYLRTPEENNFNNYNYLLQKEYIYHY